MSVLSKIRERSTFLIIIIGLALFAFVLDPSTLGNFFSPSSVNEVGRVNDSPITIEEFTTAVDAYRQKTGFAASQMRAYKYVWDSLVRKKIYQEQIDKAGIIIGKEVVWNGLINSPSIRNAPSFLNEAKQFDEAKFKQFLANAEVNDPNSWLFVTNYAERIKEYFEITTYYRLINSGLGASLKEGEIKYFEENTKFDADFVYMPYNSIDDNLVKASSSEIEAYIEDNPDEFKMEASADLSYVKFDIKATKEDESVIKSDLTNILEAFKKSLNDKEFFYENNSDLQLDEGFKYKKQVNYTITSEVFKSAKGKIIGPYKDQGYYKMSKIVDISRMPDSVKASHILIPFVGSARAAQDVKRTEEEAKKMAENLLKSVKRNKKRFAALAKENSSDTGSAQKGGDLGWFDYSKMIPVFRDFAFTNRNGSIGLVKSSFGFHIIKITGQKNRQKVVKLSTFGIKIAPSEETENAIFLKAEKFALEVSKNNNFSEVAKKNNYIAKAAIGIKALDESIPGLKNQREIVSWAFNKKTKSKDFKRFDSEESHVLAFVTNKTEKGLMSVTKATSTVKPILVREKKAKIIADKLKGNTLEEIAKANNTIVSKSNDISLKAPALSGIGNENKVVGAMYSAELNKLYKNVVGDKGVYCFKITKRKLPTTLPNYEVNRISIIKNLKNKNNIIFEAVKASSNIEDNRVNLFIEN